MEENVAFTKKSTLQSVRLLQDLTIESWRLKKVWLMVADGHFVEFEIPLFAYADPRGIIRYRDAIQETERSKSKGEVCNAIYMYLENTSGRPVAETLWERKRSGSPLTE